MATLRLSEKQWTKVRVFLKSNPKLYIGKNGTEHYYFIE